MEQHILEQILEGSMKPTNLPFETLRKITDEFSIDRIIGEGGFGTVYKGIVRTGNVAVKRIRSSMTIDDKLFRREVDSLMEVNHQNVVRFVGLCSHTVETPMKNPESRGYIYAEIRERLLCFEYISNGSLDKKITDELRGLEWDSRYQIIKGICAGLRYLHMEKCILHMDLKPANILLNNQMVPKITDFGLSRPTENSQTMSINHFSSPGYSAPENLFGRGRMSVKSDMYSLGVIIIELVTGHKDIPDNYNNIIRRWRHRWRKSAKETPLEYQQQVTKCIEISVLCQNIDPLKRPFISEIMSIFDEMESNNNHSRNANESPVFQINTPTHWEDDMLAVEPLELRFGYSKQKQILSCSVELSNDTDGFIAFKIQTTSPLPYSIKPNRDIVKPRSKCSVDITLPAANTQDHKAARQYSTNKQYTEEFIVRSIEVNGGLISKDINEDMFDKHTVGHHVDEIHLAVVSEESCSKEVMDSGSKQVKKQYAKPDLQWRHTVETTQTPMPTLIGSGTGRVHLAIKSNKWAPFDECNKKVMLELTGADYTIDRPGLDLVAIMDISGSMQGEKMEQLKTAMGFVIRKLSPMDRLSVVTFSNAVMKLCPLQQITEASQRELQKLINELVARGDTNITDGLLAGLNVLFDRKVSRGRVVAIMLMSDGIQTERDAAQVNVGNVPVYTFGFGGDSDPRVLSMIAANSMGGTFSHVQDIGSGGLTMAFSQCLAGLLTVSVQDLKLTVAAIGGESTILKATAGGYPQTHEQDDDDSGAVTISFGNLYSREVRTVTVDLLLPTTVSEGDAEILEVTYSYSIYSRSSRRLQFVRPPEMLTVWRSYMVLLEEEGNKPAELQVEEARLLTAKVIKEARTMADNEKLGDARSKLVEAQHMLEDVVEPYSNLLLRTELLELLKLFETSETYEKHGRAYALSSESSHGWQRFAARGGDIEIMRLFATQRMDKYLEQAKKFYEDPTMPLPSVEDDVEEEAAAGSEEEMRRLSLDTEEG